MGAIAPGCERLVSLLHESKHTRSLLRGSIPEFAAVCSVVAHIVRTSLLHAAATMSGDSLPVCPYGKSCYRLNPVHFDAYNHPHLPNNRPAAWGPAPATTNVRASRSSCRQVAPRSPPYVARAPCCAYVRVVSRRRLRAVGGARTARPPAEAEGCERREAGERLGGLEGEGEGRELVLVAVG